MLCMLMVALLPRALSHASRHLRIAQRLHIRAAVARLHAQHAQQLHMHIGVDSAQLPRRSAAKAQSKGGYRSLPQLELHTEHKASWKPWSRASTSVPQLHSSREHFTVRGFRPFPIVISCASVVQRREKVFMS